MNQTRFITIQIPDNLQLVIPEGGLSVIYNANNIYLILQLVEHLQVNAGLLQTIYNKAAAAEQQLLKQQKHKKLFDIKALNVDPEVIGAEDTKPEGKTGIDGVLDKIFNMQKNNPEAYQDFLRGAFFYEAGQQGESYRSIYLVILNLIMNNKKHY